MNFAKLKDHLDKYLPIYVIAGMLLGYFLGQGINVHRYKSTFKVLNLVVVISMIYPMMINLKVRELKNSAKLWKQLTIAIVMGLVVSPLLMFGIIKFLALFMKINPKLSLGLLLAVVVPCSSMSIAYTGFTDGNLELATIIVAISFTLAIAVVPAWLGVFASSYHLSISSWLLVKTILIVVVIPMILGIITREILMRTIGPEKFVQVQPLFSAISLIGMYIIVTLIFMEKAKLIGSKPMIVLFALLPIFLYYVVGLVFMTYFNKFIKIPYKDHMAITFTSIGKNEGTAMAIAMAAGMGVMAIPPAVTPILQIPMLIGYVKIAKTIKKLFREQEEPVTLPEGAVGGSKNV